MARIYLLRHADHDLVGRALAGRLPGVALNARGRQQAQQLATRFAGIDLDAVYSSPQLRTRETATPLANATGREVAFLEAFDEVDFGAWTGCTFADVEARDPQDWHTWNTRRSIAQPPGGERFSAVAARAEAGFRKLALEHPADSHVAVVSHADVLRALIASVLGVSLDHLERFEIAPASVTVVDAGEGWARVRLLNARGPVADALSWRGFSN